jgi:hypothetical protein
MARSSLLLAPWPLMVALLLGTLVPGRFAEAAPMRRLPTDGTWAPVKVDAPGDKVAFGFEQRSGCRYRMTVEPQTLERPVIDLAFDVASPVRFGAPARGETAVHEWEAEGTRLVVVDVGGFSAMTGTARLKVEGVDAEGRAQRKPEPWLGPTGERARVGDLVLGEVERWPLVLEAGRAYELETLRGEAHGVLLRVLDAQGQEVAKSLRPWIAYDVLRFRLPEAPRALPPVPGAPPAPPPTPGGRPTLEVRGLGGCGGTYGLRLTALPDDEPLVLPPSQPAPPVTRGALAGEAQGFQANPGDVALLFSPRGPDVMSSAVVEQRLGAAWQALPPDAPVGTLRSQEGDHITVVRVETSGAYRFVPFPAGSAAAARPRVFAAEHGGGAPLLLGLSSDPRVRAKVTTAWRTIAVAVPVPGFDYLFAGEGAPEAGMAMRVRTLDGAVLASRPATGEALTMSPGIGPTLRFRVREVGLLLLEVRGSAPLVRPLLRRAGN